ncbi:MAG: hypothetical protein AAF721_01690 [Myxococcota bacterium]
MEVRELTNLDVRLLIKPPSMQDANAEPRYETNEYPVLSVVRDPAANGVLPCQPTLRTATFIGRHTRPDGMALARLTGSFLEPREVQCCAVSPGFTVRLLAERTAYRKAIIVGLTVTREDDSAGTQCVVRFSCGPSYVHATIDVPKQR